MELTEKDKKVIEKLIFENCYDGKEYDFSNEVLNRTYKDLKQIGIFADKTFLKKIFGELLEKYENEDKKD